MAKLPALVKAFATFDERGVATIEQFARAIREAGEIPTTKRGAGASEMGFREAANLLIALSTSETPKSAADSLRDFRKLEQFDPGNYDLFRESTVLLERVQSKQTPKSDWPEPALYISECKTFGDAVERFIEVAPEFAVRSSELWEKAGVKMTDLLETIIGDYQGPIDGESQEENIALREEAKSKIIDAIGEGVSPTARIAFYRPDTRAIISSWPSSHRDGQPWNIMFTLPPGPYTTEVREKIEEFPNFRAVRVQVMSTHLRAIHDTINSG